ncbi:MAG: hypothetical protein ABEJ28_04495 [Salinigranum sp.]
MSPGVDLLGSVAFAFGAGVATFFAPCAYPLLPGYVGYYASQAGPGEGSAGEGSAGEGDADGGTADGPAAEGGAPLGGALVRGLAASGGVIAVFGVLVGVVAALGQSAVSHVALFEPVVGAALVVLGALTLADRVPKWT